MIKYRFSDKKKSNFELVVKQRVSDYFRENNISRKEGGAMLFKTLAIFGFYISTYFVIISGYFSGHKTLYFLSVILGLGQAAVGMNIMHDFVHGTYRKSGFRNLLLQIPVVLIGVNSYIWKVEHNLIHHTFTNVDGLDQDIHPRFIFRFSDSQKKRWFHRYQHLYACIFYCFVAIEWLTVKDFIKLIKYYRAGYVATLTEFITLLFRLFVEKILFYIVFLLVPYHLLNVSWEVSIFMFLVMLGTAGLVLTVIFQLAHVVPATSFLINKDEGVNKNWFIHQIETTSNFAIDSNVVSFLTGGLNNQIEHHLFPDVCHTHYPKISTIIKTTAQEFGVPYHFNKTFLDAIFAHFCLLKSLGRTETI